MPDRGPLRTSRPTSDLDLEPPARRAPADEHRRILPTTKTDCRGTARPRLLHHGGVCPLTTVTADGSMIEVATVGNRGMVGVGALYGTGMGVGETVVETHH